MAGWWDMIFWTSDKSKYLKIVKKVIFGVKVGTGKSREIGKIHEKWTFLGITVRCRYNN